MINEEIEKYIKKLKNDITFSVLGVCKDLKEAQEKGYNKFGNIVIIQENGRYLYYWWNNLDTWELIEPGTYPWELMEQGTYSSEPVIYRVKSQQELYELNPNVGDYCFIEDDEGNVIHMYQFMNPFDNYLKPYPYPVNAN